MPFRLFIVLFLSVAALLGAAAEEEDLAADRWYAGVSTGLLLPGSGHSLDRAAAACARGGCYLTDFFALEGELISVPHASSGSGGAAVTGGSVQGLVHFTGWEEFDLLFGSERFDPFFTFGASGFFASRDVFADDARRHALGPAAGVGAFYHLTETLSLRADARAALGCASPCAMLYTVTLGLQWSFGGGDL